MVRPVRFELTTFCSGGKRSIQTELRARNHSLSPNAHGRPVVCYDAVNAFRDRIGSFSISAVRGQTGAPMRAVTDPGIVTTRQAITPAGVPTVFDGRVYGVAFGRDASELWVANATRLFRLDWKTNHVLDSLALPGLPGLQGIRFDETAGRPLIADARRVTGGNARVQLFAGYVGKLSAIGEDLGTFLAGAIAVAKKPDANGRRLAVIPLTANNELAVVDLANSSRSEKHPLELLRLARRSRRTAPSRG